MDGKVNHPSSDWFVEKKANVSRKSIDAILPPMAGLWARWTGNICTENKKAVNVKGVGRCELLGHGR